MYWNKHSFYHTTQKIIGKVNGYCHLIMAHQKVRWEIFLCANFKSVEVLIQTSLVLSYTGPIDDEMETTQNYKYLKKWFGYGLLLHISVFKEIKTYNIVSNK